MMYNLIKRSFDLFFSALALIILSPILIPIMFILKLTAEGEVFYKQKRIGLKNKEFGVFKFATMLKNSENMGDGIYTSKGDNRILPFGHFLRKYKINELPQIINILIGNMSIVGPRPLIKETYEMYKSSTKLAIGKTKPGLTGIGSIIFRNEEEILNKSTIPLEEFYEKNISPYKGKLEEWYFLNKSILTDFIIIILTAWVIIFPNSNIAFQIFKDLPKKPKFLKKEI